MPQMLTVGAMLLAACAAAAQSTRPLPSMPSYRAMSTPGRLNDGSAVRYAMGLTVIETGSRRAITHGGGIPGYASHADYYPAEDLTVVVLFNTAGPVNPQTIAREIADEVLET